MKTRFVAVSGLVILFWGMVLCGGEATPAPAVSGRNSERSPMNPYNGMQTREEVYEFTQKPEVRIQKSEGGAQSWIITFTSKGNCDATVAVVDKDGKVIRHLASGVLGKNAPWPFQQNALAQKIEWDGQDDMGRVVAEDVLKGCRAKVGLGLKPEFEANIGYDPYAISPTRPSAPIRNLHMAVDADGKTFLLCEFRVTMFGRVFDRDGNYLRTFYPPPAEDLEKWKDLIRTPHKREPPLVATVWGDKSLYADGYGPWSKQNSGEKNATKILAAFSCVPESALKRVVTPLEFLSRATAPEMDEGRLGKYFVLEASLGTKYCRMCVDRGRDELYLGGDRRPFFRFDGNTGKLDASWFSKGGMEHIAECSVGPDGLLYLRIGFLGYGQWIARLDHDGKPVAFKDCTTPKWTDDAGGSSVLTKADKLPMSPIPPALKGKDIPALWTGLVGHSNIHERGLYVSPNGLIVAAVSQLNGDFARKHGDFEGEPFGPTKQHGEQYNGTYVQVWTSEGKLLTANAVGNTINGHGAAMDRDGNIYTAFTSLPKDQNKPDGVESGNPDGWGGIGSIVKFPGRGGAYPLGRTVATRKQGEAIPPAPEGALLHKRGWTTGAAWMYGGLPGQNTGCTCNNIRWDMDYWARTFIPANHLNSVVVLDANGNRIARLGRYGNVDDTDADVKAGRDGLRFSWIRALCVSDKALYVADADNFRVLKAALKYAAEESVSLP